MPELKSLSRLTLALLLGDAGSSADADLNKGFAAYDRGDYATTLREWRLLPSRGMPLLSITGHNVRLRKRCATSLLYLFKH